MSAKHPLDYLFHPRSIAVIGASSDERNGGDTWLSGLLEFAYPGQLYPVNRRAKEILGLRAYPSITDIPGPVDYAIFNLPARFTLEAMKECAAKGVKAVHVYSAGFSEVGTEVGKKLQQAMQQIVRDNGVRVIGPNCVGLYYPAGGLTFDRTLPKEPGPVGLVSQTGAGALRFINMASFRGLRFSKGISYGNAIDLDGTDFLQYLGADPETRVVCCYLEGVKDGPRFFKAVKECLKAKPLVVLKAGLTQGGARAAASHTASMGGSEVAWNALFRQTGVTRVESLEEMLDVALAILAFSPVPGLRVGLVGRSGGISVLAADACQRAGLEVPPLSRSTRENIEKLMPEPGNICPTNPVELPVLLEHWPFFFYQVLGTIAADAAVDFVLASLNLDIYDRLEHLQMEQVAEATRTLVSVAKTLPKPVAVVIYPGEWPENLEAARLSREGLAGAGIPVYPSVEAAARAIAKVAHHPTARNG